MVVEPLAVGIGGMGIDVGTAIDDGHAVGKPEGIAVGKPEGIAVGKPEGIAVGKPEGTVPGAAAPSGVSTVGFDPCCAPASPPGAALAPGSALAAGGVAPAGEPEAAGVVGIGGTASSSSFLHPKIKSPRNAHTTSFRIALCNTARAPHVNI